MSTGFPNEALNWIVNKDHSEIFFKISYLGVSSTTGRFKDYSGSIKWDETSLGDISIEINANSIDTGNSIRDGHLKSRDFLHIDQFKWISFKSIKVSKVQGNRYKALGRLKIKNISKDVIFNFDLGSEVKDSWGNKNRFAKFKGKIQRQDFGINWNKLNYENNYLLGNTIEIWGVFQVQPQGKSTPSAAHMIPNTEYTAKREKFLRGEISSKDIRRELDLETSEKPFLKRKKVNNKQSVSQKNTKLKDGAWWLSFAVLGFLGFISSVYLSIKVKEFTGNYFKKKYDEQGILGYISDFIGIIIMMIYAASFYLVGWS